MTEQIVVYPLVVKSRAEKDSIEGVITKHSDEEWRNLIREFKKNVKGYENVYGVMAYDIERYKKVFLICKIKIVNQKLYKKWEEKNNLSGVFISFINHDLRASSHPSFYKDGVLEKKYDHFINEYIVVKTKKYRI